MSLPGTLHLRWLLFAAWTLVATRWVACTAEQTGPNAAAPTANAAEGRSPSEPGAAPARSGLTPSTAPQGAGMPIVPIHRAPAEVAAAGSAAPPVAGGPAPRAQTPPEQVDGGQKPAAPVFPPDAGLASGPNDASAATPSTPLPEPSHRFDFSGNGTQAFDTHSRSVARLSGGAQLDGAGAVRLPGQPGAMVELPDGLLDSLESFTLLMWVEPRSEACWQRAIDFLHVSMPPPDAPNTMMEPLRTLLYLTPHGCRGSTVSPTLGYKRGDDVVHVWASSSTPLGRLVQLGLSFSSETQTLRLIRDGVIAGEATTRVSMHAIRHARAWVGRSSFDDDPPFDGTVTELRIYPLALAAEPLQSIFERGPDRL